MLGAWCRAPGSLRCQASSRWNGCNAQRARRSPCGRTMPTVGAGRCTGGNLQRRRARCAVVRKISLALIIFAGAFWVASAFVLDYPTKTQAVDHLTNSFRPAFTDAALAQSAADLRTSSTFADDFRTKA